MTINVLCWPSQVVHLIFILLEGMTYQKCLGNVPRIRVLVSTAIRNHLGLSAIISRISLATQNLYTPRSYEERDFHLAQILWRIGGNRVAKIAQKALGMPSIRTLRRKSTIKNLMISPAYPTVSEVASNIKAIFGEEGLEKPTTRRPYSLEIDELKIETRLRYEATSNSILGTCREHSGGHNLIFESIDEADLILAGLRDGSLHFAEEVSAKSFYM